MPLPTYMVIGAAKCGTTSLCALLAQHPDVFLTRPKEPKYFSRIATFERDREWYLSLFDDADGYAARGEGSATYTGPQRIDLVVPRLQAIVPECRFIYMVRHPIRRLESNWKMMRRERRGLPSINRTIEEYPPLTMWGMYWRHLCMYRRWFRSDQILVVFFEEFIRDPNAVVARVFAHIGVDPTFEPRDPSRPYNAAAGFRDVTPFGALMRNLPGARAAKKLAPAPAAEAAKRLLTAPRVDSFEWEPKIRRAVAELYRPDCCQLLEYCGKRNDYWDLEH